MKRVELIKKINNLAGDRLRRQILKNEGSMKRTLNLAVIVALSSWASALADPPSDKSKEDPADAILAELSAKMPSTGYFKSARLELTHWRRLPWRESPERKSVTTREGTAAEVVFLRAAPGFSPSTNCSLAFLILGDRVVDWASCRTEQDRWRWEEHVVLLEDVDGDGFSDVVFRGTAGLGSAHAISEKGFVSLLPSSNRELQVKVLVSCSDKKVKFEATGTPSRVLERRMFECILQVTNTSKKDVAIEPGEWFRVLTDNARCTMSYRDEYGPRGPLGPFREDPVTRMKLWEPILLKPGERLIQPVLFYLQGDSESTEVTMTWTSVPAMVGRR